MHIPLLIPGNLYLISIESDLHTPIETDEYVWYMGKNTVNSNLLIFKDTSPSGWHLHISRAMITVHKDVTTQSESFIKQGLRLWRNLCKKRRIVKYLALSKKGCPHDVIMKILFTKTTS